jgi:hypothetical protein
MAFTQTAEIERLASHVLGGIEVSVYTCQTAMLGLLVTLVERATGLMWPVEPRLIAIGGMGRWRMIPRRNGCKREDGRGRWW